MTVRHFTLEEISAWLDGELELAAPQRTHLVDCPECSRALAGQRRLRGLARRTAPDVPTERMWRDIEARIGGSHAHGTEESAEAPRPWWRRLAAGYRLPVVALAGAAAFVTIVMLQQPRTVEELAPQPQTAPVPAPQPVLAPTPEPKPVAQRDTPTKPSAPPARKAAARAPEDTSRAESAADLSPAPAVAQPTAGRAAAEPAVRPVWRGRAVTVTADKLARPQPAVVVLTGDVRVLPHDPFIPYVALVDGLSRTLTGEARGSFAEIALPEETLDLRTK
ncbi:MAG: hypothetical protein AAB368_12220 [bacterium]